MIKCLCDRCKKEIVKFQDDNYSFRLVCRVDPKMIMDLEDCLNLEAITVNKELCTKCATTMYKKIADVVNCFVDESSNKKNKKVTKKEIQNEQKFDCGEGQTDNRVVEAEAEDVLVFGYDSECDLLS